MWNICGRDIKCKTPVFIGQIILILCWQQSPGYSSSAAPDPSQKMPTADLIEIVFREPSGWLPLQAHNNLQDGFNAIAKPESETAANPVEYKNLLGEFKAITYSTSVKELLKRKDAGTELLARYRGMDPVVENTAKPGKRRGLEYKSHESLCVMEIMLAQYDILDNLTKTQRRDLLKECLAKYRDGKLGKYEAGHRAFTALLLGRVLQQEKYPPFTFKIQEDPGIGLFLAKGPRVSNMSIINTILSQAQQFLSGRPR